MFYVIILDYTTLLTFNSYTSLLKEDLFFFGILCWDISLTEKNLSSYSDWRKIQGHYGSPFSRHVRLFQWSESLVLVAADKPLSHSSKTGNYKSSVAKPNIRDFGSL